MTHQYIYYMKLLIIGNLEGQLISASRMLQKNGARVRTASDTVAALYAMRNGANPDVILMDVHADIKGFIKAANSEHMSVLVVACGVEPSVKQVEAAISAGAKEFLPLPPEEHLISAILQSLLDLDLQGQAIGSSIAFEKTLKTAKQIAASKATVLITGESGTGKEVMAKYIHRHSLSAEAELVSVNCAAIPDNLLESELFGHEKGAFTGAIERRIGKFEQANGTTLLLDEISEMDLHLQAKLLRAIQEREITRVGGKEVIKLDLRIIATSNQNLLEAIKNGTFREDLYYRLNVINLSLPPLRERKEDIITLAKFFVEKYAKLNNVNHKSISSDLQDKLLSYNWPGNVRELENVMHRGLLLAHNDEISTDDVLLDLQHTANDDKLLGSATLSEIEKRAIMKTMAQQKGDQVKTAMILGITVANLQAKLNDYLLTG